MSGKRVLVSGATAGIGRETALGLARLGAEVVVVGRNPEKTQGVVTDLKARSGNEKISAVLGDLSSMKSIANVAAEFISRFKTLDVLINNVGAMNPNRELTVDGYERTMATNHLGYQLLTRELLPALQHGGPARIVSVSSMAHRGFGTRLGSKIDFDDLMWERNYSAFGQYSRSKLANILFTRELAKRLAGTKVTANSLHPGVVASSFIDKPGIWQFLAPMYRLVALNSEQGARTSIYLASAPDVEGVTGQYFDKCKPAKTSREAQDDAVAAKLWAVSEALINAKL